MEQNEAYKVLHRRYRAFIFKQPLMDYKERLAYQQMKAGRGFREFDNLPDWVQQKCSLIKSAATTMIPNARVYLIGSWVNGGWVDDSTPQELREIRFKAKKTWKNSDIDVVVHSTPAINVKALKAKVSFPFDFTYFNLKTTPFIEVP